eukprot:4330203-Amphidinium_carterae.1
MLRSGRGRWGVSKFLFPFYLGERYDNFLKSVTLLTAMGPYERSQIADALKPETYSKGAVIVEQDEPGMTARDAKPIANESCMC